MPNFSFTVLTTDTTGVAGGLENAILGTLLITARRGDHRRRGQHPDRAVPGGVRHRPAPRHPARRLRGAGGIPSIILGYVGYVALVVGLGWHFGLLPAVLVVSVVTIPYIAKSTETALAQVPVSYREGAEALGLPLSWSLRRIVIKSAAPGIMTGLLVAIAISVGETAPLLYTAGWQPGEPRAWGLTNHPIGFLTYAIFTFWDSGPRPDPVLRRRADPAGVRPGHHLGRAISAPAPPARASGHRVGPAELGVRRRDARCRWGR